MAISFNKLIFFFFFLFLLPSFVYSLSTVSISETGNHTLICALNKQSFLNCSSFPSGIQLIPFPNFQFSGLVSGNGFLCGLRIFSTTSISTMLCWRFSENGTMIDYKQIYEGPILTEFRAGNSHICGTMNSTNQLECWQWRNWRNLNQTPSLNFSTIAVGGDFVCGVLKNGTINCLGNNSSPVIAGIPRGSNFQNIAAGFRHACSVKNNDDFICWGDTSGGIPRENNTIKSFALGENRSCGLRSDSGTVICWGANNFSLPENLRGVSFITIEAKRRVFCGIVRVNSSLLCWGNEIFNQNQTFHVFDDVLPGSCTPESECRCGPLLNSGEFCDRGRMICKPCDDTIPNPAAAPPPPSSSSMPPRSSHHSSGSRWNKKMIALLVVGCVGSFSLILVSSFFLFKFCKSKASRVHDSGPMDDPLEGQPRPRILDKRLSNLVSLVNGGQLEDFPLPILLEATDNFSNDHKIGTGSFGSVYRGLLGDGREVAIKRAETTSAISSKKQEDKDNAFLNELESLSRINHKNLVRLLGFFDDSHERVLVYEFMNNGTLHDHLHKLQNSPLTSSWARRITVALDAARGIQYLHDYLVPPIIHRDIKSSNILLDSKWNAKVSDFGLSLMAPYDDDEISHLSLRAAGTVGYMDPEYYRLQQLTTKSDVYSFGVVLLELLSGTKAIHKNENGVPRNVVDVMVPYIVRDEIHRVLDRRVPAPTPFEIEAVKYVGYLAADCVISEGRYRPSMSDIVNCLERALGACLAPTTLSRSSTESST